jgi:cytochrome P450
MTSSALDALLDRIPLRTCDLGPPPPGMKPVRGDRGLPFVGLGIQTVRDGPAFQLRLLRRHGPVAWWQAFGRRIVAAAGPEAVQAVLANKAFASGWPAVVGPWFDGGLLAMDAPEHRAARQLVRTAYDDLTVHVRRITEDVDAAVANWPMRERFLAVPATRQLSCQITTRAFLGIPYDPAGRRLMRLVESCIRAETALLRLPVPGTHWRRAHRARGRLIAHLHTAPRTGDDFLSVLSRVPGLTARQVAEHMLFTLIASHDTTTTATLATIYFLGKHPEWQRRALEPDTLDLVIKESLRLVSPSPILMRVAVRDTEILGHHIPAGQLVSVCTGVNQLLPELWPNPERFDPQRFRDARIPRLAWAPFGAGAHKCVGQQLGMLKVKATITAMLRGFEWTFPTTYEAPWRFTSLPAPADGLPIVLHPAPTGATRRRGLV